MHLQGTRVIPTDQYVPWYYTYFGLMVVSNCRQYVRSFGQRLPARHAPSYDSQMISRSSCTQVPQVTHSLTHGTHGELKTLQNIRVSWCDDAARRKYAVYPYH